MYIGPDIWLFNVDGFDDRWYPNLDFCLVCIADAFDVRPIAGVRAESYWLTSRERHRKMGTNLSVRAGLNAPRRNAIVFTANTPHVAQANLMISSLFDSQKGRFDGDLWVISTHLDERCQRYLDSIGVKYLINPLLEWQEWRYKDAVATSQPEFVSGKLNSEDAFLLYRNKRMSKLIICDWVEKFGDQYDMMALCDNDLYFQRDVNELFAKSSIGEDVVWYWQEENANLPGTNLWKKNFHYARLHGSQGLDFGEHEINIGFVIARPNLMRRVFNKVGDLFRSCDVELFTKCGWHDQDLVRLIRAKSPEQFDLFAEGDVLHLCNGGEQAVEERFAQQFYHRKTNNKPYVIHFAGGVWKNYPSVSAAHRVEAPPFFFMQEQKPAYDVVRSRTEVDIFDRPSKFFSNHNQQTRDAARARWIERRRTSSRKSCLFFSWLDTGSHQPLRQKISTFLDDNTFDLAIVDGNVNRRSFDGYAIEDLPDVLSRVTQSVTDRQFSEMYGYRRFDIPEEAIAGAIEALRKEYNCPERSARAVANVGYDYLVKAAGFYRPNVVVCWGTYLLVPRLLKYICQSLNIPFLTMELGVLPDTLSFDCLGHMGESWVAQFPDEFNKLPISSNDLQTADEFLRKVSEERPSRNIRIETSASTRERLVEIRNSGKKIVVFAGSNDAFSGHVPYDDRAKKYHSPFFVDNQDIVSSLSAAFGEGQDVVIVYKPHPITLTRGLDLKESWHNIVVLNDVNLDDCIEIADLVISNVSQSSYEALLRDTPVLMVGRNQINGSNAVYTLKSRDQLEGDVRSALEAGYTEAQRSAFRDHVSRLLKYQLYNVVGGSGARSQAQIATDIDMLLYGDPPTHLRHERSALLAFSRAASQVEVESPAVSVIMPIYNGEEYLAECISSILNQSLRNLELICVNNGSTDGSQAIIDYFVLQDRRVKTVYQEEPSQTKARNLGATMATGEYLYFSDCDDFLEREALRAACDALEETAADVVYFFFKEMYDRHRISTPRHLAYQKYLPEQPLFKMSQEHRIFFAQYPFPWAKVFRRKFFEENALYFDVDCSNFDDNPQNLRTLLSSDNIYVLNRALYRFRIHSKSMTQSVNPRVAGMLDAVRLMNKIFDDFNAYELYRPYYVSYKVHLLHFAWERLPEELKPEFFATIPSLFVPGDEIFFRKDSLRSMFSYLGNEKFDFIEDCLRQDERWRAKIKNATKVVVENRFELSSAQKVFLGIYTGVASPFLKTGERERIAKEPRKYFGPAKHPVNAFIRSVLNVLGPQMR